MPPFIGRCGAHPLTNGQSEWRLWAPRAKKVDLLLYSRNTSTPETLPMQPENEGYYTLSHPADKNARYAFLLDATKRRPDPCSLFQPEGPSAPSALFDPAAFRWTDHLWAGISQSNLVFYELHTGTFTPEGTFDAIIPRLPALRELGITAIELMPVAQFPGTRNWGYDGVLPYAAQNSYGGPLALQRLVNAAHLGGLAVYLDVVYNHLGPELNYLDDFAAYFTDRYKTPWGLAINFDGPGSDGVRKYILDNTRMWLEEFHLDGLRLDAVHAIYDFGAHHILAAVKEVAEEVSARTGFTRHLIAESDLNDPRVVLPRERGGYGLDGQWSDDFHHAVHVFLTGERRGYYGDFTGAPQLAPVLQSPFLFAGSYSPARQRTHGAPPTGIPADRFVVCLQNHDQVGNRAQGDRLTTLVDDRAKLRLGTCLLLFSPYLPLLFMGEEYGETRPFPFFCSFESEELIKSVREGRRREFADFVSDPHEIPDPQSPETFAAARLTWSWPAGSWQEKHHHLYQDLLKFRKTWPALIDTAHHHARYLPGPEPSVLELIRGSTTPADPRAATLYFNLTGIPQSLSNVPAATPGFSSELQRYGGTRQSLSGVDILAPFECIAYYPSANS